MKKKKVVVNDIQKDCHDIISLAPKYDEDIKQYEDIITSALSELEHPKTKKKKNKNIAITGIYGAGKSTVIRSYFNLKEEDVCYVTLGYYSSKEDTNIVEETIEDTRKDNEKVESKSIKKKIYTDDEIEKGILQQILYSKRPGIISNSRFSRIDKFEDLCSELLFSFSVSFFTSLLINWFYSYISNNNFISLISKLSFWLTLILSTIFGGILVLMILRGLLKINKFTFHNLEIGKNKNDESVLNNNIDELLHFFLYNKESIVVFEDLDRLPNAIEVFSKLKEINAILNSSIENKTIQFIYVTGDSIFKNGEDRTKFFDIIIPIVPLVSNMNAKSYLLSKKIDIFSDIEEANIKIVSKYIKDYRQANDIINEYRIYLNNYMERIDSGYNNNLLLQDKNQLFYLIAYKVLYPYNFSRLFDDRRSNVIDCVIFVYYNDTEEFLTNKLKEIEDPIIIEMKSIGKEIEEKSKKLYFDGKEINLNLSNPTQTDVNKFTLKFTQNKPLYLVNLNKEKEIIEEKKLYTDYQKWNSKLIDYRLNEKISIINEKITHYENENNIKFNDFEKELIENNVINENYKRLLTYNFESLLNLSDERYVEELPVGNYIDSKYKLIDVKKVYKNLTDKSFTYNKICVDDLFMYINENNIADAAYKMRIFLENMNDYRFQYILKFTLSNAKNSIIRKNPELINYLWDYAEGLNVSDELIIKLIIFTLQYCKTEEIDDKSHFYICINTFEHLDDIFEENLDNIQSGLLNTLVKFNRECEYNPMNINFLNFIYENKRFYGNIELIIAIIKSRGISVNNKNFMTMVYNNKEELYNLYEYIGPLFKKFFEECIDQIISLENSDEVIQDILSSQIASIEQKRRYLNYEKGKIHNLTTIDYIFLPYIVKNNIYELNWENLLYILNGNYDKYNELNILEKTFKVLQDNIRKLVVEPLSDSKKIILTDIVLNKVGTETSEAKEVYLSNKDLVVCLINNSYLITDNVSTAAQIYKFQFEIEKKQINQFLKNSFKYFKDNISNNIDERLLEDILSINLSRQKRLDFYLNYQHIYNDNINKKLFKILIDGENLKISNKNLINILSRFEYKEYFEISEKYHDTNKISDENYKE